MLIAFGMPGATELMLILVIVIIFFGVGKLPQVLGQMGKGVRAFKEGVNSNDNPKREIEADFEEAEELRSSEGVKNRKE